MDRSAGVQAAAGGQAAMKVLFLVNPAAGHGRAAKRWKSGAENIVERLGASVWQTAGPGDASLLVRRGMQEGFEAIIAVGGDGTISETVQGYLSAGSAKNPKTFLGTWPAGSGCDTARHLGIKRDVERWSKLFINPNIQKLDAGKASYLGYNGKRIERFFLNIAALGIPGDVALRGQAGGKPFGGTLSYLVDSLAVILKARSKPLELRVNGVAEPPEHYHMIALANTRTTGGGMIIAPKADAQDGRLDFIGVGNLSRSELLRRLYLIYVGGHIGKPGITHRLINKLEVSCRETVHLNIDGEVAGTLPATFEVLPGAVPFLCPIL